MNRRQIRPTTRAAATGALFVVFAAAIVTDPLSLLAGGSLVATLVLWHDWWLPAREAEADLMDDAWTPGVAGWRVLERCSIDDAGRTRVERCRVRPMPGANPILAQRWADEAVERLVADGWEELAP